MEVPGPETKKLRSFGVLNYFSTQLIYGTLYPIYETRASDPSAWIDGLTLLKQCNRDHGLQVPVTQNLHFILSGIRMCMRFPITGFSGSVC